MFRSTSRYIKFKAASSCYRRFQEAQQRSSRLILLLCSSNRSFDRQRIQKHEGTKKPGPSVRLTHSRSRKKNSNREPGYAGLCSLRTHTSSKAFLKGKLCFFFPFSIWEFDTFGCIVSIPRDRAKADALWRNSGLTSKRERSAFPELRITKDRREGNLNSSRTFIFGDFLFRNAQQKQQQRKWHHG